MKKRLIWGILLIAILLCAAALMASFGDAWGPQYCNASQTFCITPLQQHTGEYHQIRTTLYSGKDFRPFLRTFNNSRWPLDADELAFDQEGEQILVYSNDTTKPLKHAHLKDWKALRMVHVDGDPCAFITTLKYNYTPAARCWHGQFHE